MEIHHLTVEARQWAVKELAHRAGASQEFIDSWQIESRDGKTVVFPDASCRSKQISFAQLSKEQWEQLNHAVVKTLRTGWMPAAAPLNASIAEFLLQYCVDTLYPGGFPLFEVQSGSAVYCAFDLPACILFKLCCLEEANSCDHDAHGRFPIASSRAFREGYLDRPIVDEYGLAFQQALDFLLPSWRPVKRRLRVKLSHDVDDVGRAPRLWPEHLPHDAKSLIRTAWMAMPCRLRSAIQETTQNRSPFRTLATLVNCNTEFDLVRALAHLSVEHQLDSSFYWKASPVTCYDSGYDPRSRPVRSVISEVRKLGCENGVHPGYDTYLCPQKLQEEVEIVRSATGECALGGRQHYLRWCPQTWTDWESVGLAYDSSVGFADHIGFRSGTCVPYHPWFFAENRVAKLLEVPLVVMDTTLTETAHMNLTVQQSIVAIKNCVEKCRAVGGVFTFLCHNTSIHNQQFLDLYEQVLTLLSGSERFDWRNA